MAFGAGELAKVRSHLASIADVDSRHHHQQLSLCLQAGALWGGTLLALLLAALLLKTRRTRDTRLQGGGTQPSSSNALHRLRRILAHQMPPRDLWLTVCGEHAPGDQLVCWCKHP